MNTGQINSGGISASGNVTLNQGSGANKWTLHAPDDSKKVLYIAPHDGSGNCCDGGNSVGLDNKGKLTVKSIQIGSWNLYDEGGRLVMKRDGTGAKVTVYGDGGSANVCGSQRGCLN